jgi:VanZ family protein
MEYKGLRSAIRNPQSAIRRLWLWWSIAAASVLALYASAPYVLEMQILLRRSLQDYFDVIFRTTIAVLGVGLLASGLCVELWRSRSAKPHEAPSPPVGVLLAAPSITRSHEARRLRSVGKIVLKKIALSAISVALYYFGLFHVICTNPARGVRIIEFIHLFEYSLITILVLKAVSGSIRGRAAYVAAFLAMYLVSLGDEAVQGYIARRVGEFRDVQIDALVAGLAIVAVRLVFSPRVLAGRSRAKVLRPILLLTAASVIATAAFMLSFHVGHRIDDERCGVFYSLYPREELLRRSAESAFGPQLPRGGSSASAAIKGYWAAEDFYETEANKHLDERDDLLRRERHWEAFCEEQVRRIYYKQYTDLGEWKGWTAERMRREYGDYDIAGFTSLHDDLVFRGF